MAPPRNRLFPTVVFISRALVALAFAMLFLALRTGVAHAGTLDNLMEVLEEDKNAAAYDMDLNAPFSKASSGYLESVDAETGELSVTRTELTIPGRNGLDLVLRIGYESGAANLFDQNVRATWTGGTGSHTFAQAVVAYYEVFRSSDNYWLRSDWMEYGAYQTITGSFTVGTERWVFSGYVFYSSDPTTIIATNDTSNVSFSGTPAEKSAFLRGLYSLGEGWRFALPAVEISAANPEVKWLHLDDGAVYKVGTSPSGLEGYSFLDMVFSAFTGYGNGVDQAAFRLRHKDGREVFFSSTGRLIGQRDRFGNEIRYFHTVDGQGVARLTRIVDTRGRVITISYSDTRIAIAAGARQVVYERAAIPGYAGKHYLRKVIDPAGRATSFSYDLGEARFWVFGDMGKTAVNRYANLAEVGWPTGADTTYAYATGTKKLGLVGEMQYFRTLRRADEISEAGDAGTGGVAGARKVDVLVYNYYGEPDGCVPPSGVASPPPPSPLSVGGSASARAFSYATRVTDQAGLTTTHYYDSDHHSTLTTFEGAGLAKAVETTYDPTTGMPLETTTTFTGRLGAVMSSCQVTSYDLFKNLVFESSPYPLSDPRCQDRAATYVYDPTYHLQVAKKQKRDLVTTAEWVSELTRDGKAVAETRVVEDGVTRQVTAYVYDGYGNVIERRRVGGAGGMGGTGSAGGMGGSVFITRYEYGADYQGAYLTRQTTVNVVDADGRLGNVSEDFVYDPATGWLTARRDPNGNVTTFQRDLLGRVTKEGLPTGEIRKYAYDDTRNQIVATDERGYQKTYRFDGLGRLLSVGDNSSGLTLAGLSYDAAGRRVKAADGNGNYWSYTYDPLGRLIRKERRDRLGLTVAATEIDYNDAYLLAVDRNAGAGSGGPGLGTETGPAGFASVAYLRVEVTTVGDAARGEPSIRHAYYYDRSGYLALEGQITRKGEDLKRYSLDYLGNVTAETDYLGRTTLRRLDWAGQTVEEVRPTGAVWRYSYDALGGLVTKTDPLNNTTFYAADALGRVVREVAPFEGSAVRVTKRYYDPAGNLVRQVDPVGRTSDRVYDRRGRLVRVIAYPDPSTRNITKYDYDGTGNLVKVTTGLSSESDPQFSLDRYLYDSLGRKVQWIDPLGQSTFYTYDPAGNLTAMLDRNGITTRYGFDALSRMVSRRVAKDGELLYDTWVYGLSGARLEMNDGTGRSSYVYDELGRCVLERNPGGVEKRYSFDALGNRTSFDLMWDGGKELDLTYEYDPENRLAEVSNEGDRTTYEYDPAGRVLKTVNQTTGLTDALTRNDAGLPVSQLITWGPRQLYVFSHDYDLSGDMVKKVGWGEGLARSDSGEGLTPSSQGGGLTPGGYGGASGASDEGITRYAYDGMDRLTHVEYPDGRVVKYEFDDLGNRARMVEMLDSAGSAISQTTYTYDAGSRLLTAESVSGGDSRTVLHFGYDRNGNQVAKEDLIYAGGSVVGDNSWSFGFDGLNRLNGVVTPEAGRYRYTYAGDGLRVGKQSLEEALQYVWDGDDVVAELRTYEPMRSLARGLGLVSQASGDEASYFLHNVRGDIIALYSPYGRNEADYAYSAYGDVEVIGRGEWHPALANSYLHNEQYRDRETSLYYLRARYYDASTGRFLSEDPAKSASLLLYLFTAGNPIRYADITGLAPTWACVGDTWTKAETTTWMFDVSPEQGLYLLAVAGLILGGVALSAVFIESAAASMGATGAATLASEFATLAGAGGEVVTWTAVMVKAGTALKGEHGVSGWDAVVDVGLAVGLPRVLGSAKANLMANATRTGDTVKAIEALATVEYWGNDCLTDLQALQARLTDLYGPDVALAVIVSIACAIPDLATVGQGTQDQESTDYAK